MDQQGARRGRKPKAAQDASSAPKRQKTQPAGAGAAAGPGDQSEATVATSFKGAFAQDCECPCIFCAQCRQKLSPLTSKSIASQPSDLFHALPLAVVLMMYGFGDDVVPLQQTVDLVEVRRLSSTLTMLNLINYHSPPKQSVKTLLK